MLIEDGNNTIEFGDITIDKGSAVRQDMVFDRTGDHLYVVTANKVRSASKSKVCDRKA